MNSTLSDYASGYVVITSDSPDLMIDRHVRPSLWSFLHYWHDSLSSAGDKRLQHLPLLGSPLPITFILTVYILFVKFIGPHLMKNREPFELKTTLLVYNALMVILSTCQFIRGGIYGWFGTYSYTCQPIDYSNSWDGVGMAYTAYIYYLSKIIELLDTVFFVLRKKQSQVTTLHISHHAGMAYLMYWGVKFWPGGHGSFQGFVNSFVHIFMYLYYLLAGMGPKFAQFLWWKQYMTQLQLAQFAVIFIHSFQLFFRPDCNYPRVILYPYLSVCAYFTIMFINFYRKAYIKRTRLHHRQDTPATCLLLNLEQRMKENVTQETNETCIPDGKEVHSRTDMIDLRSRKQQNALGVCRSTCHDDSDEDSCSEEDIIEEDVSSKKVL